MQSNEDKTLYHYTSVNSAYNFLKEKEFWFSNATITNDKNEIIYFVEKMKSALMEELPEEKDKILQFFENVDKKLKDTYPYIMCLSKLKDDASQWERYADNAKGINIGFNKENLKKVLNKNVKLNEVFYSFDIKQHDHYKILYKYFKDNVLSQGFTNIEDEQSSLIASSYFYKHYSFESEKEVRVATLWKLKPDFSKTETKLLNGQVKRVLKVNFENNCNQANIKFEDLIDKIIIGPRSPQNKMEFQHFLEENNLSAIINKVEYSESPLR